MKALVIGHGRMGRFHARVLADLGCDVTTLDPDPLAGADHSHARQVGRYSFDAVAIATPIEHLAPTAALWAHRARHLLIEKPMAASAEEARELMVLLSFTDGVEAAVGYVERFNPQFRSLRERISGHRVVCAAFTRYNPRPTADVALDLQSHDVDLARTLGLNPEDHTRVALNTRAGAAELRREITVATDVAGMTERADLTQHETSPLHAQWHALLSGSGGYATPADALAVLEVIARRRARGAAPIGARA